MATVREGTSAALLVIDVQNGPMSESPRRDEVVGNIVSLVDKAREDSVPVMWVQHNSPDEMPEGSEAWQLVSELSPAEDELHFDKQFNDAFQKTDLEEHLADLGISHLYICGAATNQCIRATCYGAMDRGYDVTLIGDAHTTSGFTWEGVEITEPAMVAELNATLQFISYPGITTRTITHDEVD